MSDISQKIGVLGLIVLAIIAIGIIIAFIMFLQSGSEQNLSFLESIINLIGGTV